MSTPPSPLPSPAHDNGPDLNSHLSCEKKGRSAVVLRSRSRRSARAGQTSKVAPLLTSPLFVPFSIFSRLPDFHFHHSAAPFTTPPDSQFAFHSPPARSLLFPPTLFLCLETCSSSSFSSFSDPAPSHLISLLPISPRGQFTAVILASRLQLFPTPRRSRIKAVEERKSK